MSRRLRTLLEGARKAPYSLSSHRARGLSSLTCGPTIRNRSFCDTSILPRFFHPSKPSPPLSRSSNLRFVNTRASSSEDFDDKEEQSLESETDEYGEITWEEEDEAEPELGDGGDGGGIVLQGVPWGDHALTIANEVLLQFGDDMKLFAFKTTPRGYLYLRLDKLSNEYGCPSMEEIESFSHEYKQRLDEAGASGKLPDDLAFEVSSPGAERLLRVPDDLPRFKDMPMRVCYLEDAKSIGPEKDGVFMMESIEAETENCVWKLADVKENRDPQSKGRPLSRKQKDWRLKLPYAMHKRVALYLEY